MMVRIGVLTFPLASPAFACTCSSYEPEKACQLYQKAPIIFRGRLIDHNDDSKGRISGIILYRFRVVEAFKGLTPGQTQVFIDPASGTSCQTEFSSNQDYLFYVGGSGNPPAAMTVFGGGGNAAKMFPLAWKGLEQSPVYRVGVCSPHRVVKDDNDDDLKYLRSARTLGERAPGWIDGRVVQNASWPYRFSEFPGMPNTRLTAISSSGDRKTMEAQPDGAFYFGPIPPGSYGITATSADFGDRKIQLQTEVPAGGCGVANISFETQSKISGKVVDAQGKAASGVRVELGEILGGKVRAIPRTWANTDRQGSFEIRSVPVGNFVLAANLAGAPTSRMPFEALYAPGTQRLASARVFSLRPGGNETGILLRLPPPLPMGALHVEVEWPDGTPARDGARAFARFNGAEADFERAPGESNRVDLQLALQRKYEVRVDWLNDKNRAFDFVEGGSPQIVDFTRDGLTVKLRLKSPKP